MDEQSMNYSNILSTIAISISVLTFIILLIDKWHKRPMLNIFLETISYIDKKFPKKEDMLVILMINDGYSPVIISQCVYKTSDGGEGNLGIYDELKAPYGSSDIVLPRMIKPAESFRLNFLRVGAVEKITEIVLIDSHDKKYYIAQEKISFAKEMYKRRKLKQHGKSS
jgi:hypothetical protein